MKWKKYLTAEEAALFAVGLGEYGSFKRAEAASDEIFFASGLSANSLDGEPLPEFPTENLSEGHKIHDALLDELAIAADFQMYDGGQSSPLTISHLARGPVEIDGYFSKKTRITRESLGIWFYGMGDKEKALLFNPEAELDFLACKSMSAQKPQQPNESIPESTRTPQGSLLEAVGLMALLLCEKSKKYKRVNTPNASQIASDVIQLATELYGLDSLERTGLSNLNRDIKKGAEAVSRKMK
jgi:hypothetical protein